MNGNQFERANRARKVSALVDRIDTIMWESAINPHEQAAAVAVLLATKWTALQWAQTAVTCAIRPPSDETIAEVVEVYKRRAEKPALMTEDEEAAAADFYGFE